MKKIICFIESLTGGGAEHQLVILAELLYKKGYDVTVVTMADIPDHYKLNENIQRIKLGVGKSYIGKWIAVLWYFLRVKADCIISYRQKCNIRVLPALIFRPKMKVIVSERNLTYGKPHIFEVLLFNIFYYRANYIVPNSYSQRKHILSKRESWSSKTITIINYTDIESYPKQALPIYDNILRIAVFARLSYQKNLPRFLKMLSMLKTKTDKKFIVHWYGNQKGNIDGYNQDYIDAIKLIEEYNISDVVELIPAVKNTADYMSKYHVISLPSLFEGFSNSIGEAICSCRPVICGDVSDNGVMVQDKVNGFLFDPTSEEDMVNSFLRLLDTPIDELAKMGLNSRKRAEELFNADTFINNYINLIES